MPTNSGTNVVHDSSRLAALDALAILDTPSEEGFDDIVHLASRACSTPVALVSLVASDRQWFKANVGFPSCETDLSSSVCAHALAEPDLLVIPDLTADRRTVGNPLVTGEPHIRFYAGAPLRLPGGAVLGSLCVIDQKPRPGGLTTDQADVLRRLARQVVSQLELRRALAERDALLSEQRSTLREREAHARTQSAISASGGDLGAILEALVDGAMQAVPAAEAGAIELIDGDELEYRAVKGTIRHHVGLRVPLHGSLAGLCALTNAPVLVGDALKDGRVKGDLVRVLGLRSAVFVPVSRGDKVLGVLKLQSSRPAAFAERDLELARMFSGLASGGLTEASEVEARRAVLASEVRYRAVFESAADYAIVVMDLEGHVTDWNGGAEKILGWSAGEMRGHTVERIFTPEDIVEGVPDREMKAALTSGRGVDERWHLRKGGERFFAQGEMVALRQDGDVPLGFVKILRDRTEQHRIVDRLKDSEQHNAGLVELGDRLRDLSTQAEITRVAAEVVAKALDVTRAGYGRVDHSMEYVTVDRDWTAEGQASIVGRHRFDGYGQLTDGLLRGEPLIVTDVRCDPRTATNPAPLSALDVEAMLNVPVWERGHIVALFFVHDSKPRAWKAEEVGFLQAVADRVEATVARLEAEQQQHVLNQELSHRLKNTLAMVQAIATQTLKGLEREPVDAFKNRLAALGGAHDLLLQQSWTAAPIQAVVAAALNLPAGSRQFEIQGLDLHLGARAVLSLSLLLHELATNASKYGALSVPDGRVRLYWRAESQDVQEELVMTWVEEGGPHVVEPTRRGFGSRLIRMGLVGTGQASLRYETTGLVAEFRAPLNVVSDR